MKTEQICRLSLNRAVLLVAVLCALVFHSASAQPISQLPYTNSLTDGDRLAIVSISTGTNGVTKQVAYSNLLANAAMTNLVKVQATNAVAELDPRYFYQPQDQNLYLSNTIQRFKQGGTLRIMNFGDDAFHPTHAKVLLNQFLNWSGTIGSAGGDFYADTSAGVTQNTISGLINFGTPIYIYTVNNATGGGMTNRLNPISDTIAFGYYAYSGFSAPWIVMTNDGGSGAYGIVKTIDPNNGGAPALTFTNIAMPTNTWRATIWTTGTNAALFCGQYLQGGRTNYLWDVFESANGEIINTMTNSFASNTLVTLAGQYDLVILNDAAGSNQAYSGYSLLYSAMTNRFPRTDLLFLQPPPATNNVQFSIFTRQGVACVAADTGLSVLDTGGMFLPIDYGKLKPFYTADAVHLSDAGNALMARRIGGTILNPWWTIDRQGGVTAIGMINTNPAAGTATNLNGVPLVISGNGVSTTIASNTVTTGNSTNTTSSKSGNVVTSGNTISAATGNLTLSPASGGTVSINGQFVADLSDFRASSAGDLGRSTIPWGSAYVGRYAQPTNGIPANPVAGRPYSTNTFTPVTIGTLASVPTDSFVTTWFWVTNSATTNILFTGPAGSTGPNGTVPGAAYLPPGVNQVAIGTWAQTGTNLWVQSRSASLGIFDQSSRVYTNAWSTDESGAAEFVTNYFTYVVPKTGQYRVGLTWITVTEGGGTTVDSISESTIKWTDPFASALSYSAPVDTKTVGVGNGYNLGSYGNPYTIYAKGGTSLIVSNYTQNSYDGGGDTKSTNFVNISVWGSY